MTDYHPVVQKIKDFLDDRNITYKTFKHEAVRTSEQAAATRPGYTLTQGAKALLVKVKPKDKVIDTYFVQLVIPGDARFDSKKVCQLLKAKDVRFATEVEVGELTDGVLPGGVPPFGNLFGLKVLVEPTLLENEEIIFNAGDRRYSIAMKTADYREAVKPEVFTIV